MSKLLEQIKKDQLVARKEKNSIKASVLTTLIGEASPSGNDNTDDGKVLKVVQKFVKNLDETIGAKQDRGQSVDSELQEKEILETYLPTKLSSDELSELVDQFITENNVSSPKQMGMVMGHFSKNYQGQYDGKELSTIVKGKLG